MMAYTNSPLVNYTELSPNHSGQRTHKIDRITIHCVVGQCTVERLAEIFYPVARQASSNYGVGYDGRIGMYVEEKTVLGAVLPMRMTKEQSPLKLLQTPHILMQ